MYCPACGKKMPNQARFCYLCGANLAESKKAPEPPDEPLRVSKGDVGLDRSQTVVVHVGKDKEGEKPLGDHCAICGTFVRLEESFRCRQCGRDYLCLSHRDEQRRLCEECAAEAPQELVQEAVSQMPAGQASPAAPHDVDPYGEIIFIPAGEFLMGSSKEVAAPVEETPAWLRELRAGAEMPQRVVYVDEFHIAKYPVTNARYRAFMEAGGYGNPEYWSSEGWEWREESYMTEPKFWNDDDFNQPNHPVVGASYYESEAYCRWAGLRLPTEQEWEKAARGTDGRVYPWGDEWQEGRCNSEEAGIRHTTPVNKYRGGASPCGVMDMAGNLNDWTTGWYDSEGVYRGYRPLRGGSWNKGRDTVCCAFRDGLSPASRREDVGFRCARSSP